MLESLIPILYMNGSWQISRYPLGEVVFNHDGFKIRSLSVFQSSNIRLGVDCLSHWKNLVIGPLGKNYYTLPPVIVGTSSVVSDFRECNGEVYLAGTACKVTLAVTTLASMSRSTACPCILSGMRDTQFTVLL